MMPQSSTHKLHYELGRLKFSLSGESEMLPYLKDEFQAICASDSVNSILRFTFDNQTPSLNPCIWVGPIGVGKNRYRVLQGELEYQVDRSTDVIDATISLRRQSTSVRDRLTPNSVKRFRHWNYLLWHEDAAKSFMYGIFDYLTQIAQVPLGQSYIHASSFERDGRGVAVAAWGGVGKTTSMVKLVTEDQWRFLSDDLGVIDESGTLWRSPKRLQVYAYNVEGQPNLYRSLIARRSMPDRMAWHWKRWRRGTKGVRRRVSAEELFGPADVGRAAELRDLIFLERVSAEEFYECDLSVEDASYRAAHTLAQELDPYFSLAAAASSCGNTTIMPTICEIIESTQQVLRAAFANVQPRLVQVPNRAGPDELVGYMRNVLSRT